MSVEVPDEDIEAFKRVIAGAIQAKKLPDTAKKWFRNAKGTEPPPVASKSTTQAPPQTKARQAEPDDDVDGGLDPSLYSGTGATPTQFGKRDDSPADILGMGDPFAKKDKDKGPPKPKLPSGGAPNLLPHPQSAATKLHDPGGSPDDSYKSPFNWGNIGHFGGGSSWDAASKATDPESMPKAGGGWGKMSRKSDDWLSGTPFGDDTASDGDLNVGEPSMNFSDDNDKKAMKALAKPQKKGKRIDVDSGSRNAKPFDISQVTGDAPKKQGMLSRIFGKKKSGGKPDDAPPPGTLSRLLKGKDKK